MSDSAVRPPSSPRFHPARRGLPLPDRPPEVLTGLLVLLVRNRIAPLGSCTDRCASCADHSNPSSPFMMPFQMACGGAK